MRRTAFKISGYTLYGLLAFIVFVYIMFPYDLLRQRAIEHLSQGNVELNIASVSPTFPPGLAMRNVHVAIRQSNAPQEVIRLQTLRTWPQWLSLFSPAKSLGFTGQLYNGNISGDLRYTKRDGTSYWESLANFDNLDVSRHALLQDLQQNNNFTVEGRLNGTASTRLTDTGQFEQGDVKFKMKPAILTPGETSRLFIRKQLPCDDLNGAAVLTRREWQIEELNCQGDDIMIDLRGTFRPRSPWHSSVPNLRVSVQSETAFKEELDLLSGWALQRPPGENGLVKFALRGRLDKLRPVR
ncbi:type II secretion system protein GspN [Candidatus Entotheonella serta]|nr:type II secretion system protein GspN [Candidatus Entotheonella serta]